MSIKRLRLFMSYDDKQYRKMTETPVSKLVIQLSIPTTISMLVTSVYNLVDSIFVGKLGTSASGAIGIVFSFMAIIQAFGFTFGQGGGSIISRKLGAKNIEDASRIASTSFFGSFATGVIIAIISIIFLDPIMYICGSSKTILPYAKTYVMFIIAAAPFMMSTLTLNNILRYEGKASLAMIGLMSGAILNIVGDPLLMFVFDLKIAGAGLSTAISQVVSFSILLFMFLSGKTQSKISIKKVTKKFSEFADIVATGFPSFVRQGMTSVSTMILNGGAVACGGDAAVSAMSIVNRITMFMFSISVGIGQGFQPVSAFNYGAKKFSRVKKAFKFTYLVCEVALAAISIGVLLFSSQLVQVFRDDPDVIRIGTFALRAACIGLILQPLCLMANMSLQSTGQKKSATFVALLRSGLYFIPVFYILKACMGLKGVQIAQPVADVLSFLTSIPFVIAFLKKMPADGK